MTSLEPFYFGEPGKLLLGCYHGPATEATRDCAVVLAYPMGHEYMQFHRAFRQLAALLADCGFPALRFDFYGCGDSSGACEEGRPRQWLADISSAIGALRSRCRSMKVCLVGLRLGGTLSMMSGAERGDIDGMVLWDPMVSGKAYIDELRAMHKEMLRRAHVKPRPDQQQTEMLGFLLAEETRLDIENIDLLTIRRKPANNILVIESHKSYDQTPLAKHLESLHAEVRRQHLSSPQFWTWMEDLGRILVPRRILETVVGWISEVYP